MKIIRLDLPEELVLAGKKFKTECIKHRQSFGFTYSIVEYKLEGTPFVVRYSFDCFKHFMKLFWEDDLGMWTLMESKGEDSKQNLFDWLAKVDIMTLTVNSLNNINDALENLTIALSTHNNLFNNWKHDPTISNTLTDEDFKSIWRLYLLESGKGDENIEQPDMVLETVTKSGDLLISVHPQGVVNTDYYDKCEPSCAVTNCKHKDAYAILVHRDAKGAFEEPLLLRF